jgi:hypothetical protein
LRHFSRCLTYAGDKPAENSTSEPEIAAMPVLLTALLSLTLPAVQDTLPPRGPGGPVMRADSNGDGVITRDEHLAQAAERFDRMDLNRDGKLTADELQQIGRRMRSARGDTPPPSAD